MILVKLHGNHIHIGCSVFHFQSNARKLQGNGKNRKWKVGSFLQMSRRLSSSLYSFLQDVAYLGNHSISSTDCVASERTSATLMVYHNLMFLDGFWSGRSLRPCWRRRWQIARWGRWRRWTARWPRPGSAPASPAPSWAPTGSPCRTV